MTAIGRHSRWESGGWPLARICSYGKIMKTAPDQIDAATPSPVQRTSSSIEAAKKREPERTTTL